MKTLRVKDIMHSKVFSVNEKVTAFDVALKMRDENVGSLLVKEGKDYLGIVTTKDISHKIVGVKKDPAKTNITEIMSSPIIMIEDDLPIHEAVNLMTQYGIKRLVVSRDDKVVGMVSARLVIKFINSV